MESKTATALGAGIVSVITPLVFPAIPLMLGVALYSVAGGLFVYAGRDKIRAALPGTWKALPLANRSAAPAALREPAPSDYDPIYGPVELTEYLASRLVARPISAKTLQVLHFIAAQEVPEFALGGAVRAVPGAKNYMDIKGAWAGITRRTRKILSDPGAYLIQWRETYDTNGDHLDWVGRVTPMTHASLRKALRISTRTS